MFKLIFIFSFFLSTHLHANEAMTRLFHETFYTHYQGGLCKDNILALLERGRMKGIDVSGARMLEITNTGFTVFGLVNAEFARGFVIDYPGHARHGQRSLPEERNWDYHVVLLMDGLIYDFDFGNEPRVLKTYEYFEHMFLDDQIKKHGFYAGREAKLRDYQIIIYRNKQAEGKYFLGELLENLW